MGTRSLRRCIRFSLPAYRVGGLRPGPGAGSARGTTSPDTIRARPHPVNTAGSAWRLRRAAAPPYTLAMLDEAAVAELYTRYGHALYRRCLTLLRNEADAHELLQEVFCQFFKNRGRFLGQSS